MHADLSRWIFRPDRHYSRVVAQQGRVSLDADANAQASILLHYLRTLAADLIGPSGGPSGDLGFGIATGTGDKALTIGPGRYYVDGLLCEADGTMPIGYFLQPDGYGGVPALLDPPYLVWLKVWERFISAVEDPALREVALGLDGPDTTGRTRVVWQVLASPWPASVNLPPPDQVSEETFYGPGGPWAVIESQLLGQLNGTLMAQAVQPPAATDACTLSPSSGYRGPENQLYRVEIHQGGTAPPVPPAPAAAPGPAANGPTFMWSRDNGSVILPITKIHGSTVSVTTLGRDPQLSVDVGNYVEIVDDAYASQGQPGPIRRYPEPLHRVTAVDPVDLTVTLDQPPATAVGSNPSLHPYLRRWDQDEVLVTKAGLTIDGQDQAIDIAARTWIDLEDGVQVQFSDGAYRAGDYWLIPARVITGNVEWPAEPATQQPLPLPPMGVRYHLAPLAIVYPDRAVDVRKQFSPLASLPPGPPAPATGPATPPPSPAAETGTPPQPAAPQPVTPPAPATEAAPPPPAPVAEARPPPVTGPAASTPTAPATEPAPLLAGAAPPVTPPRAPVTETVTPLPTPVTETETPPPMPVSETETPPPAPISEIPTPPPSVTGPAPSTPTAPATELAATPGPARTAPVSEPAMRPAGAAEPATPPARSSDTAAGSPPSAARLLNAFKRAVSTAFDRTAALIAWLPRRAYDVLNRQP